MDWYIVHVCSGYEKKVMRFLENEIKARGLEKQFGRIIIPLEKVATVRKTPKGQTKRVVVEKRLYPGYIFVEMDETKEAMRLISQTPGVIGFLGVKAPRKVSKKEAEEIIQMLEESQKTVITQVPFHKGDSVRIIDGPFTDFTGTVEEVMEDKEKLRVMITIFGRSTPVELSFSQVQPI